MNLIPFTKLCKERLTALSREIFTRLQPNTLMDVFKIRGWLGCILGLAAWHLWTIICSLVALLYVRDTLSLLNLSWLWDLARIASNGASIIPLTPNKVSVQRYGQQPQQLTWLTSWLFSLPVWTKMWFILPERAKSTVRLLMYTLPQCRDLQLTNNLLELGNLGMHWVTTYLIGFINS